MQKKTSNKIILISSVFTVLLLVISSIILIRFLGPAQVGLFISIYLIPSMLIRLTMMGSRKTVITHLVKGIYSDNEIVSSLFFLWIFSSTMAIGICMINFAIMQHAEMTPLTHFFILATIPLRLFIVYSISVFFGKTKFNFSILFRLLPDLFSVLIIFILVFTGKLTITGAIITYFFLSLIFALFCFILMVKLFNIRFKYNKVIIKELSSIGLISALAFFIMQLNYRFDIILLYKYTSNYDVGIYALGTAFTMFLWIIPDSIGYIVKKKISEDSSPVVLLHEILSLIRGSLILGFITTVIMYFLAPFIVTFIFGNKYQESVEILRNILPGVFFFMFFRTLRSFLYVLWKPDIIIKILVPTLIINIVSNIYLIPIYGSIGAAWASNISYILGGIATIIVFSYKMKISLIKIFSFNLHDFLILKKVTKIGTRKN